VVHLLIGGAPLATQWWAFGLLGLGIAIDFWRSGTLKRVAASEVSAALAADAKHFEADIYASCAVLIGLAGVALGFPIADAIAALLVSGFIFWLGYKLGSETISALLDRAPEGVSALLHQTLAQESSVLSIDQLRVRQVGRVAYVSFVAFVPRSLATTEIAALSHRLKALVQNILPGADVNAALEPVVLDSETAQQKVLAIAAQQGLSIHHLVVQDIGGKRAVSFDVELPERLSLGVAHERATVLESAIRTGLGGGLEVESHIEPRPSETLLSVVAEKPMFKKVELALKAAVRGEKALSDVHNIRLRRNGAELYLHYHCRFAASLSLEACHAVLDRVEARLMAKLPQLKRVVAHAEPLGHAKHNL
jgi:divalent metal cation (Fe/Co/Zn/Cd) transporter